MQLILSIHPPFIDPVIIFTIILIIVLLAPLILKRINIPDIVGLILAGVIIGPHGFNLLSEDIGLSIFGTIGLLYLMFLAGLEININEFYKNKKAGTIFGLLTFFVPLILAFPYFYWIQGYTLRASVLIAIMLSSHTLVAYPIIGRLGIVKLKIVTTIIAATIIADTAVLIILGVVTDSVQGELSWMFWIKTFVNFTLFFIYIARILPFIARWFFRTQEADRSIQYIFVLSAIFISATLAEFLKIEPLIGAFFTGLSLNRLIIRNSPLMNRIVFIGNTLFIPFFIITIGMQVNVRVIFTSWESFRMLAGFIILALSSKYIAAWIMQKTLGLTAPERNLAFGMSTARAASAIAIVLIGSNLQIVNELVLNNTVVLILITSLISSFVTQNSGKKILRTKEAEEKTVRRSPDRIMVSISNPETIERLLEFSMIVRSENNSEPIYPITVVPDSKKAEENNEKNRKLLEKALSHGAANDTRIELVTRIDINAIDGITRAMKELQISKIIVGWHGRYRPIDYLFGTFLERLLKKTGKMIIVTKISMPLNLTGKMHVVLPAVIHNETGFPELIETVHLISDHTHRSIIFYGAGETLTAVKEHMALMQGRNEMSYVNNTPSADFFEKISTKIMPEDLLILISARKNTTSYNKFCESYPKIITQYFSEHSIVIMYPEQTAFTYGLFRVYDYPQK